MAAFDLSNPDPGALQLMLAALPSPRQKVAKVEDGPHLSQASATRIGLDDKGTACFVSETPVFHLGWQDRGHLFGGSRWIDVHRYEIKVAYTQLDGERADAIQQGRGTGVLRDDWILVSKLPYSLGRVAWVKLKKTYRDAKVDQASPPDKIRGCAESLWDWLDGFSYDYWETRSNLKTAAFRIFEPAPVLIENLRNPTEGTGVALGICTDPWTMLERIRSSDDYHRLIDTAQAAKHWGSWTRLNALGKGPRTFPLNDPTLLDHASEILELSLRQAMAGPDNMPPNSLALLRKPVMLKARWIFDEHIKRLNERVSTAEKGAFRDLAPHRERALQAQVQSPEEGAAQLDIGEDIAGFLDATMEHLLVQEDDMLAGLDGPIQNLFVRVDRLALSPEERLRLIGEITEILIGPEEPLPERLALADALVTKAGG